MSNSVVRSTLAGILMIASGAASAMVSNAQGQESADITPDVPVMVGICTENKSVLETFGFAADSDLAKHYTDINKSYAQKIEAAGFDAAPCNNLS